MRIKVKNPIWPIVIAVLCIAVSVITGFFGSTSVKSGLRIGYVGSETKSTWWGNYISVDGTMQKTMRIDGDVLVAEVETEEGTFSLTVKDTDGNAVFSEENMGTCTREIPVSGKIRVVINFDHHKGSFSIHG